MHTCMCVYAEMACRDGILTVKQYFSARGIGDLHTYTHACVCMRKWRVETVSLPSSKISRREALEICIHTHMHVCVCGNGV